MWNLTRDEQIVIFFGAVVFLVGMGVKILGGIPRAPDFPVSKELIKVEIVGAVKEPGWYEVPKGSLVIEGIRKAGGALPQANLGVLDLSSSLENEEEIWVHGEMIDINRASPEQLVYLPGIGPVLAQRIVDYRKEKGSFSDLSQLKEVSGIGEVRFEKIKGKITLDSGS